MALQTSETVTPVGRDALQLVQDQLAAIDAWHAARRADEAAATAAAVTREQRLDLSRRTEARRREQAALVRRAEEQLEVSVGVLSGRAPLRAVVAHRNGWMRDSVATQLSGSGVLVVGCFDDGADAAGTVVCEQPDLVLVEDRLPTLSGLEVVRRTREFAPRTLAAVQVDGEASVAEATDTGARAVFTRRIPPRDVVEQLLVCLAGGSGATVALR